MTMTITLLSCIPSQWGTPRPIPVLLLSSVVTGVQVVALFTSPFRPGLSTRSHILRVVTRARRSIQPLRERRDPWPCVAHVRPHGHVVGRVHDLVAAHGAVARLAACRRLVVALVA